MQMRVFLCSLGSSYSRCSDGDLSLEKPAGPLRPGILGYWQPSHSCFQLCVWFYCKFCLCTSAFPPLQPPALLPLDYRCSYLSLPSCRHSLITHHLWHFPLTSSILLAHTSPLFHPFVVLDCWLRAKKLSNYKYEFYLEPLQMLLKVNRAHACTDLHLLYWKWLNLGWSG